jgi:hypothetical protein
MEQIKSSEEVEKMSKDKLHLTISSANGDWENDFSPNQPIHAVKTTAMAHLHMDPSQADQFILTYNGQEMNESKSLADHNVPDGAMLILERRDVTKIGM